LGSEIVGSVTPIFNVYLQKCDEARGTPRGIGEKIDGNRIVGCSQNVIFCDELREKVYSGSVGGTETIYDLQHPEGSNTHAGGLRFLDDEFVFVFSVTLIVNNNEGTCKKQGQQEKRINPFQPF
jgi:hypothetical protein